MRLRRYLRRKHWDRERARELEAHLVHEIDDNLARGMTPEEARRQAHIKVGNVVVIREEIWRMNSFALIENLGRDLRYALRRLLKSPGFAAVAILTLTLGIGATTAIFTLVYDVLLKPLPYAQPNQLVVMRESVAELKDLYPTLPMNASHFENWQRHSRSFQSMAVTEPEDLPLGAGTHPRQVAVLRATSGIFAVLGVRPWLGRGFRSEEDYPGREHVVVLMHGLWETQFHSDPNILGKIITLNGMPSTVIGVMPQPFHLPTAEMLSGEIQAKNVHGSAEALVPLAFTKEELQRPRDFNFPGLARLKPGVSAAQAQAELNGLERGISAGLPANEIMTLSAVLIPFQQYLVGNDRKPLGILLAAVAGLLFVGCINIMNLLLARAVGRRQEMAVASALGASRTDLFFASVREAAVLAAIGGALGVLLAAGLIPVLQQLLPAALNLRGNLHVDWIGATFALSLAVVATLLAGAAPAWMSWKTQPQEALRGESRSASESRSGKRLRKVLVATEVAVSVALVLMTGLLTVSLQHLMHVDRGFQADRVLTATIEPPAMKSSRRMQLYRDIPAKLRTLPGVETAAVASVLPLDGDYWIDFARVPGDARPVFQIPTEHWRWISPGYFQTLRLPLVAGRFLNSDDYGRNDAVISASTAKTLWPGKDPIGRQFTQGDPKNEPFTVIGVVGDARTISLATPDPMMVYVPYWYHNDVPAGIVLRTKQDPSAMADALRKAVWSVDPSIAVPMVRTLDGLLSDSVATRRFEMNLLLIFAVSAWLLAGLGVYGVVTYSVAQRRHEIGVRIALGAQRATIYAQVLREGLAPVAAGAVVGIAVSFAFARLLGSLLFHVDPFDPVIATGAAASLLLAGIGACLLPARRAASVDPMRALRAE